MATTKFINECKNGANSNRLGEYEIGNANINQSNHLSKMELKDSVYSNGTFIGGLFDKTFDSTIINKPSSLDLNGATILNAKMGIRFGDNTTEYVSFDEYIVEGIKDTETKNSVSFTAYGSGGKLEEPYNCTLDFEESTHTVYEFYVDVCTQLGLTPTDASITNGTISVVGNPFTNKESCRVALQAIEKVSCSFLDIDWANGTCSLKWFSSQIDYEFNTSDYSSLDGNLIKYGPLNSIIIGDPQINGENVTKEDSESIELNGEHQIIINEPYFLYNEELRAEAIDAIFDRLDGFEYYDIKLTALYGKPFLKVGDKIKINVANGSPYITYIMTHTLTYDGTFKSIIESPALTQEEEKTKNYNDLSSIKGRVRRTEINANKQEGIIEEITETISGEDGLESKISSVVAKQTDTERTIEIISTNINTENGEIQSVKTTTGYTFDKDGLKIQQEGQTYNSLFNSTGTYYKDGETILGQTTKDGSKFKDMDLYGTYRYGKDGIDDEPMFIALLYEDNNEEIGFGHFYNGG